MKARKKKTTRLTEALPETAADMNAVGILNDTDYSKITLRHLGKNLAQAIKPVSGDEIRSIRERSRMSQAVFARYLNVTTGYVSQLERGIKHPMGAALVLIDVIRRKGIEAIL